MLWVGTSIMNGAAANRPGMGWPQQASRMLGMQGVNLGFGGLGLMQPFYAASGLLSEVNASIMVVDCEFNIAGTLSRWRDCHFTDTPFSSILKHLLKGEGGAAE